MHFPCNNCNLNHSMMKIKERLEDTIIEKNQLLLDDQVINLSQLLDNLVYKCVFCDKNINNSSKLTSNDILNLNINSRFQYLENNHFFISMYFYMFEGIKNNQIIYISMEQSLYNYLLDILKIKSISTECIKFRSITELIISNNNGGLMGLEKKIKDISLEDEVKNYSGIRWISQPTYAIKNTSLKHFLAWEMNLSQALIETTVNSSLEFVYKDYNYMVEDKYIPEPDINASLDVKPYIFDDLIFIGADYKF